MYTIILFLLSLQLRLYSSGGVSVENKRHKFQTRLFLLVNESVRNTIALAINNLPIDSKKPLEIVMREQVKKRSSDQNSLYWHRLNEISEQAFWDGRQFNPKQWHIYCKNCVMTNEITLVDGTVRSKFIESPGGCTEVISTTELERKCFADYITAVEAFGASLGVMFSVNPKEVAGYEQ